MHRGARLFVNLSALALFAHANLQAQNKAVGWGQAKFDSGTTESSFVGVEAGGAYSVAWRANGEFELWGGLVSTWNPAPALTAGTSWVQVSASHLFAVALRSDGVAFGWPNTALGSDVSWLGGVVRVAAGDQFTALLLANGSITTVGSNQDQISVVPALPAGVTYVDVAAGPRHAVAVRSDGTAVGWGWNSAGQATAPPPPPGRAFTQVSASYYNSAGLLDDGSVVVWGLDAWDIDVVPPLPAGTTYTKISAGVSHMLALRSDGQVVGWGENAYGQCDAPALPTGLTYLDVSAGGPTAADFEGHSLALRSDGRVVRFGRNHYMQLGPPPIPAGVSIVKLDISDGGLDTGGAPIFPAGYAVLGDGELVAWGESLSGQLQVPALPPGTTYVDVDAGDAHALALRSDGTIVGVGSAAYGHFQNIPGGSNFVEVSAGAYHNLARRSDGSVVAWGSGLGASPAPVLPPGVTYVEIEAAQGFSLARRSDGQVVAWGYDDQGQTVVPPLPTGLTYVEIAAGRYHSLARRSDGAVIGWGYGPYSNVPALPPGVTYVAIEAAGNNSIALRSDGLIVRWGEDPGGLSGIPTLAAGERFTQVAAGNGVVGAIVDRAFEVYCTAKVNSLGCTPSISALGAPSASLTSGFTIFGSSVRNQRPGLLFYTVNGARAALPFQCGVLCTGPGGLRRTPIQSSGGQPASVDNCTGVHVLDLNAFAAGALGGSPDPGLRQAGAVIRTQWWGRDSGFVPPCNSTLTDALEFTLAP